MTPKEKAIDLVEDMHNAPEIGYNEHAKQCALIAVDELIKYHDTFMDVIRYELPSNIVALIPYKYWDEVKQEIEKL